MIKIGLLGFGTVGSGVYEIINTCRNELKECTGQNIEVTKILVRDIDKYKNSYIDVNLLTINASEILDNPNIDIVVEVIGGVEPAYSYISYALNNEKHVVTANKAVVSKYMKELTYLAKKNNKGLLYEASVAGGIPIIKSVKESIKINKISRIKGILNGTTNFILSKMYDDNIGFNDALKIAHELGYAEADPTDDIEGYDAARKIAILSSLAFRANVSFNDIACRGITSVSAFDVSMAKQMGLIVKLIGSSILKDNKITASVEPVLIDENSPFAAVKDAFNIVSITGNTVGELQFYGQGAGKNPTANAVVSDIIDILNEDYKIRSSKNKDVTKISNTDRTKGRYYIRTTLDDNITTDNFLDELNLHNLKYEVVAAGEYLVLITEKTSSEQVAGIINSLDLPKQSCFFMRIDSKNIKLIQSLISTKAKNCAI
ncbi:homoserine dehydrogenase [Brassicibacter mesophilus]|uniref:homoserine dehydrogenase n=1 Tax=Brassicibacter mesophilus TaxID=745119 RepID=UPI003D1D72B0